MSLPAVIVLLIVVALPFAWFAAEFGERRSLRIGLGIAAIVSTMGVAYVLGELSRWNYDAWYGAASKSLVDTTVQEIEDGNVDRVVSVLRRLNLDYRPTYENRTHYDELVEAAVLQMTADSERPDPHWDTSPFARETWVGHWENDTSYWLVIDEFLDDLEIVRSGDNPPALTNIELSDDFRTLTFNEGDRWRHELTLHNKYEATHVWHDLTNNRVWRTETMYKLRRATPAQRAFTQQKIEMGE
jgi:hypothetical protein